MLRTQDTTVQLRKSLRYGQFVKVLYFCAGLLLCVWGGGLVVSETAVRPGGLFIILGGLVLLCFAYSALKNTRYLEALAHLLATGRQIEMEVELRLDAVITPSLKGGCSSYSFYVIDIYEVGTSRAMFSMKFPIAFLDKQMSQIRINQGERQKLPLYVDRRKKIAILQLPLGTLIWPRDSSSITFLS